MITFTVVLQVLLKETIQSSELDVCTHSTVQYKIQFKVKNVLLHAAVGVSSGRG